MNYRTLYEKEKLRIFLARGKGPGRKRQRVECIFSSEDDYSIGLFIVTFNNVKYTI